MREYGLLGLLIALAYLLGSVPFGLLVGRAKGIDIRAAGSGNIGATNVGRLLGGRYFAIVFLLDLLKSLLPMVAAGIVLGSGETALDWQHYLLWLAVGGSAILGHMYSIFLKFRGGKGVATSAGVILGLFPYYTLPALMGIGVWILIFLTTRYVSLASIIGTAFVPIFYVLIGLYFGWPILRAQLPLLIFAFGMASLIILRHRGNISRLRAGTESRFVRSAPTTGNT